MKNVPLSEIPSFVAAALAEHDNVLKEEKERHAAFPIFASACENAGIEVKPGDFVTVSAADLRQLTDDLSSFVVDDTAGGNNFTGAYNQKIREWER